MEDFELLLLSQPNSSFAWIKYMSYYINSFDFESTRVIAERALRTISFREEDVSIYTYIVCV